MSTIVKIQANGWQKVTGTIRNGIISNISASTVYFVVSDSQPPSHEYIGHLLTDRLINFNLQTGFDIWVRSTKNATIVITSGNMINA